MNAIVTDGQLTLPPDIKTAIESQVASATLKAEALKAVADSIDIDGPDMAEIANTELRNMATLVKTLDERRLEITRPIDSMKTLVMDAFKRPGAILADAEKSLRGKVQDYLAAERRKAQEAQRAADEAARKAREEAAERLRAAQAEADAVIAKNGASSSEALAAVQEIVEAEEAVALAEVHAAPVVLETKLAGTSVRARWVVQSFDKQAMIQAAVKDPSLAMYLEVDEKRLRQYATMMGSEAVVPGVVFGVEETLSVRRK